MNPYEFLPPPVDPVRLKARLTLQVRPRSLAVPNTRCCGRATRAAELSVGPAAAALKNHESTH